MVSKWACKRARMNYGRMLCGLTLERRKVSRFRRGNAAVAAAVDFLYRGDNANRLSWGTTRIPLGGGKKVFVEARNRLRSRNRLWQQYDREMKQKNVPATGRLRRTAFFRVARAITAQDLKVR